MAKIPLRVYNREIENLINRGQIDEAVGHCKHILRFFPKHIDTYRLLGKAFLEGQHYAEASDVLQRVLSCVPDDFISQVGMSIIREDEGNLDAAIWHMERAFEVQPANTAVQGEMRRLYGRRDGVEPPKVRLTRGALVRMYARGELYQQAIAEIRTALTEDPKRIDIEVILARMYFLSGMKVEATEVCSRLITKLPFCYEANRILAEILPETARADDAKVYQQRVDAMEPYAAYISKNTPTLEDVPDNVVTLDRLEWEASEATPQKPEWARTVGIEWEEQQESLPEWMSSSPEAISSAEPVAKDIAPLPDLTQTKSGPSKPLQQETAVPEAGQPDIPDWMQAAGWGQSTGPEVPPSESAFLEDESATAEIASSDMPDWLRAMAPKETPEENQSSEDQSRLDLLSNLLPENPPASESNGQSNEAAPASAFGAGFPDWLNSVDNPTAAQPFAATGDETPDWLKSEDSSTAAQPFDATGEEPPDWLKSIASATDGNEPMADGGGDMPAWLQSEAEEAQKATSAQAAPVSPVQPENPAAQNAVPESTTAAPSDKQPGAENPSENPDDAFAWLEALATKQGAAEETLLTKPEERIETPPAWLQQAAQAESAAESVAPEPAIEPAAELSAATGEDLENEVPDWLKELQSEPTSVEAPESTAVPQEEPVSPEPVEQLADEQPEIATSAPEATENEEVPDWLKSSQEVSAESQVAAIAENLVLPTDEVQPKQQPVAEAPAPDTAGTDEDSAFAWLESLAARQGADEETLLVKPEERLETPPDWVQKQIPESQGEAATESAALPDEITPGAEPQSEAPAEELPDWLKSIREEPKASETQEEAVPDWLKETSEEVKSDELSGTDVPDWLKSNEPQAEETPAPSAEIASETPVAEHPAESLPGETPIETPVAEVPVEETSIEPPAAETPIETPSTGAEISAAAEDDAFAWLESLAAKQGAAEEELLLKPEDRLEKPPEWVSDAAVAPSTEPAPVVEPAPEAETAPVTADFDLSEFATEEIASEKSPETESETAPETESEGEQEEESEESGEDVPDWLKNLEISQEETNAALDIAFGQPEIARKGETEAVDAWLQELPETQVPVEKSQKPARDSQSEITHPVPVAKAPEPTPVPAPIHEVTIDVQSVLGRARAALNHGKVPEAVTEYLSLIKQNQALDATIQDLKDALYQHPVDIDLWQAIGDAYAHSNRLQDALDSYTKAEELLR